MNEKLNIFINGNEKSKEEIVYNNAINDLDKDEQIKYLKNKLIRLELEKQITKKSILLMLCAFIGFSVGIIFMILEYYLLGIITIFSTFASVMSIFYLMFKKLYDHFNDEDYNKIEHLRKMLNIKLK